MQEGSLHIIYSAKNGEDNVYFLNRVDNYDLYALLYAGKEDEENISPEEAMQAAEAANGRIKSGDAPAVTETETTESEEVTEEEAPKQNSMNKNSMALILGLFGLAGFGGAFFFLNKKKGISRTASAEPDDDDEDIEIDDEYKFYDNKDEE